MKPIVVALGLMLAATLVVSGAAQSKKKPAKAKPVPPTPQDNRPVSASPVIEGDPSTKPDDRVVSAQPVIEGDPMIPEDRITIDELKGKLAAKKKVLILDVRSTTSWMSSTTKIKGAVRVRYEDVEKRMSKWKKTREVITYCA